MGGQTHREKINPVPSAHTHIDIPTRETMVNLCHTWTGLVLLVPCGYSTILTSPMNHFVCYCSNNWKSKQNEKRVRCVRAERKLKCNEKLKRWLYLIKAQGLNTSLTCSPSDPLHVCMVLHGIDDSISAKCIKIFSAFDSTNDEIICAEITTEMKDRT